MQCLCRGLRQWVDSSRLVRLPRDSAVVVKDTTPCVCSRQMFGFDSFPLIQVSSTEDSRAGMVGDD